MMLATRHVAVLALLLALLAVTPVASQEDGSNGVDTVFLVSTANYPDAFIAAPAASKLGAPILVTERGSLPEPTSEAINDFNPSDIVIVGGEAVVSSDVEEQLRGEYSVTRLWGVTRYVTSVEVAERFWPEGTESAVLVENDRGDRRGNILSRAASFVRERQEPIFLTTSGDVPASVLASLQRLGVDEVDVIGTELSASSLEQLDTLGIDVDSRLTAATEEGVEKRLAERMGEQMDASDQLVVVAAGGHDLAVASMKRPATETYVLYPNDDAQQLVTFIEEHGIGAVKVVGAPERIDSVAADIKSSTEASVSKQIVFNGAEQTYAAEFSSGERSEIAELYQSRSSAWEQTVQDSESAVQAYANTTLEDLQWMAAMRPVSNEVWATIKHSELTYNDGQYMKALRLAQEAENSIRSAEWERIKDNVTAFRESVRDEANSVQEELEQLEERNDAASSMLDGLSVQEQLDVVGRLRVTPARQAADIIRQARDMAGSSVIDRLDRASNQVQGWTFSAAVGCAGDGDPGVDELNASITAHETRVTVAGSFGLSVPTYRPVLDITLDQEDREISLSIDHVGSEIAEVACDGVSTFRAAKTMTGGNWTVDLKVLINGDVRQQVSDVVQIAGSDNGTGNISNGTLNETNLSDENLTGLNLTKDDGMFLPSTDGTNGTPATFYHNGSPVERLNVTSGENTSIVFAPRRNGTHENGATFVSDPDSVFGSTGTVLGGERTLVWFETTQDFTIEQRRPDTDALMAELNVSVQDAGGWCEQHDHGTTVVTCVGTLTAAQELSEYCDTHECPSPDTYSANCEDPKVTACSGS